MITKNQYKKLRALYGCKSIEDRTSSNIKSNPKIIDACQNKDVVYLRIQVSNKEYIMETNIKNKVDCITYENTLFAGGLVIEFNSDKEYREFEILPDNTYVRLDGEHFNSVSAHSDHFCIIKDNFRSYVLVYEGKGYRLETENAKELSNYCYVYDHEPTIIKIDENNRKASVTTPVDEDELFITVDLGEEVKLEDIDCGVLYELK